MFSDPGSRTLLFLCLLVIFLWKYEIKERKFINITDHKTLDFGWGKRSFFIEQQTIFFSLRILEIRSEQLQELFNDVLGFSRLRRGIYFSEKRALASPRDGDAWKAQNGEVKLSSGYHLIWRGSVLTREGVLAHSWLSARQITQAWASVKHDPVWIPRSYTRVLLNLKVWHNRHTCQTATTHFIRCRVENLLV